MWFPVLMVGCLALARAQDVSLTDYQITQREIGAWRTAAVAEVHAYMVEVEATGPLPPFFITANVSDTKDVLSVWNAQYTYGVFTAPQWALKYPPHSLQFGAIVSGAVTFEPTS